VAELGLREAQRLQEKVGLSAFQDKAKLWYAGSHKALVKAGKSFSAEFRKEAAGYSQ
jgi:hypothetical protein